MGLLIQCVCVFFIFMFRMEFIQGYSPRTNSTKLEIVESRLNTVITELKFVQEDLKEEKEKFSNLEKRLNALEAGGKRIPVDINGRKYLY